MVKILLVAPVQDEQTGKYIHDAIGETGNEVAFLDWKEALTSHSIKEVNEMFLESIEILKPDITLIIKCPILAPSTIKAARLLHQHKIIGWIFDVTLAGTMVSKSSEYVELIKEFDKFYTIDNDAVEELKTLGVNAAWLSEGCHLPDHQEQVLNSVQKRKYGEEVVFMGSVGGIHPNRTQILALLHKEGIPYKIYGDVLFEEGKDPVWCKDHHTGFEVINNYHSIVVGSSKIILGIDGWPSRSKSYSARLYRTLAAGGFYLTTHTKDIEKEFVPGVHLDTYKTNEELLEKIFYYLMNDTEREKIAKSGQKLVLEKHRFHNRILQIIAENI